jgi:hypothetical protein
MNIDVYIIILKKICPMVFDSRHNALGEKQNVVDRQLQTCYNLKVP